MREGPYIQMYCTGCIYSDYELHQVQGDSEFYASCVHPEVGKRSIGNTAMNTPNWCPLLESCAKALQREAAMVNDLNGVKSFCFGAFHEILRASTVEEARTLAEMSLAALAEHTAGLDNPGTREDPVNWRRRR